MLLEDTMPESHIHTDIKADLYWSLCEDGCYAEVEKNIGRTRTDVLVQVGDHLVAVEIQHTRLSLKDVVRRMRQHALEGAHTLWLFTPELLIYNETNIRNFKWVLFIQSLQGGMIFMPGQFPREIIPARVDNSLIVSDDMLVAGRKVLEKKDPISLDDLSFETLRGFNVVTCPGLDWDYYEER